MTLTPAEDKAIAIADKIVPAYRNGARSYSCTGHVAKMWQAAFDGALSVLTESAQPSGEDEIERVAAELAASDGLNWHDKCPYEDGDAETGTCDSSTCVAALYEDHEPDVARGNYRKWARVALEAAGAGPQA